MDSLIKQLEAQKATYRILDKEFDGEFDGELLDFLEVDFPDNESKLLYIPLPKEIEDNVDSYHLDDNQGIYHHVKPSAFYALQPRRTMCYSYAYNYSKTIHPVEQETPPHIERLYQITNELFNLAEGVNMDLVNYYPTGRHYISSHSDNEKQFGTLKDVYCWVFGPASRLGIFKEKKGDWELHLNIPEGLYVMAGLSFQHNYTHEFPELYPALFKRMCKYLVELKEFPKDIELSNLGASQEGIMKAEWIKKNKDIVREFIRKGKISKGEKINKDLDNFEEWCLDRTSHTLRQFISN